MYCNSISQSYNPENTVAKFWHFSPESYSGITLNFDTNWVLDDLNAPLSLDVWTLAQNFILKISGVLVLRHIFILCQGGKITESLIMMIAAS
jgi:hypothetical protein